MNEKVQGWGGYVQNTPVTASRAKKFEKHCHTLYKNQKLSPLHGRTNIIRIFHLICLRGRSEIT